MSPADSARRTAPAYASWTRLNDGRRVCVRPIEPRDADAVRTLFESAPPSDVRRRFLGQPPPLAAIVRALTEGDGVHHLAVGAFSDGGQLVGVAQFDRIDDRPTAEFAIEVASDWQHDHLGSVLLRRLAVTARRVGIERFTRSSSRTTSPSRGCCGTPVQRGPRPSPPVRDSSPST